MVAFFNGKALPALTSEQQIGESSEQMTKFEPVPMSRKLIKVHCDPALIASKIRNRLPGFWINIESASQILRFPQFRLSTISSFELALSAGTSVG